MSRCMALICPIVGDTNLDHLVKMLHPSHLYYKIILFLS